MFKSKFIFICSEEVTRIYFYIDVLGNQIALPKPNVTTLQKTFKSHRNDVEFFKGDPDDIDELKKYRFHYDLLVKGEVTEEDVKKFEMEIDRAWKNLYQGTMSWAYFELLEWNPLGILILVCLSIIFDMLNLLIKSFWMTLGLMT